MNTNVNSYLVDRNGASLIRIFEGRFKMGSERHYPEEGPMRWEEVAGFSIHATPVTNAMFAEFIAHTGYVTQAERSLASEVYPGVALEMLQPASLVFMPPDCPVKLDDVGRWWSLVPGADWCHPLGPGSNLEGLDQHPVVHVGLEDAHAYGWVANCPPKKNGNLPLGEVEQEASLYGVINLSRMDTIWPTFGRGNFPGATLPLMDTTEPRRWVHFLPMVTVCRT
jgi:hypothetical protein